ncbi:IS3 family transposase [Adlercreutzia caecimuris]|uniref:IS3 family transposase n=1 Tax=Adlercreutzia caecimuris TaxID=671266 RepID=UPI0034E3B893
MRKRLYVTRSRYATGPAGRGRTAAELEAELADYMDWCNRDRIEASLGGTSPYNYRKSLGLAA